MAANSLDAAHHLIKSSGNLAAYVNQCNKGILVGGFEKRGILLTWQEVELVEKSFPGEHTAYISEVAFSFKSLLKPQQGVKNEGTLYRSSEYILLELENDQLVAVVDRFLSVSVDEQYQTFVEGEILEIKHDEDGNSVQFGSTGYIIVLMNNALVCQKVVVPVTCILRKVIIYPNPSKHEESVVIDFQRKTLPLSDHDVHIPFYPKEGDMVLINGTDPEPWLAKVLNVNARHYIAKVFYYVKSGEREESGMRINIYTEEKNSRLAYDKVSWNSIIGFADGEWNNAIWEMPL